MIRGLTCSGLGDIGTDEQLIKMAADGGFGAVDIDATGLVGRHGAAGANELLEWHGVKVGAVGLPVEWRAGASFPKRCYCPRCLQIRLSN
ncbi:hypothetical protein [Paenibacillus sp. GCM10027626]|uniref:hypothetical protein n=1 Tax=Paenibacillus sp. GCM10027626 TaxID=3273411 RepID=UPI003635E574